MTALSAETSPTARITTVLNDWLQSEILDSDLTRNQYLSEFSQRVGDFYRPFDESGNQMASKAKGHYDRMKPLLDAYRNTGVQRRDDVTGKLIHHALMEVSGAYRKQCYFEAASAEDYVYRRQQLGPTSINMFAAVAEAPDVTTMDEVIDVTLAANKESRNNMELLHVWVAEHEPEGFPLAAAQDEPVIAMRETQRLWVGVTAAHILVAADIRGGDLALVPFLEPKSISDTHEPFYPFRQQ